MTPLRNISRRWAGIIAAVASAPASESAPESAALAPDTETEQGDVPGWVMITLMTAGLVVLIWAVAGPALTDLFNNAIQRVINM